MQPSAVSRTGPNDSGCARARTADPILSECSRGLAELGQEIRLVAMPKRPGPRVIDPAARELAARVAREARARCGPNSTFEERRDTAAAITGEVLAALAGEDAKLKGER